MKKPCYLYTLEGVKEATASVPFLDYAKRKVVAVSALDYSFCTHVSAGLAKHRFEEETKPTFYAC